MDKKWLMTLNTQKCKHMHIGRSEQHNNLVLKDQLDQDIQLIPAENEKDLGVTFDKDMKFGVHIQTSVNKANKTLGIIFRTYTYMDIEMFKTSYTLVMQTPFRIRFSNLVTIFKERPNFNGECPTQGNKKD